MRILELLADHATRRPDSFAVRAFGPCAMEALSYGDLWNGVRSLASILRERTGPGRTVMLSAANRPEFFIAVLGTLGAGRTIFPVHPRLTGAELRDAAVRSGAEVIIAEGSALDGAGGIGLRAIPVGSLRSLPSPRGRAGDEGSPGLMLQSSGTTGLPKIVYRDGASLDAVAANVAGAVALTPEDRVLASVPLGHSYGIENGLLGPVWAGACVHACDGLDVPIVTAQLRAAGGATVLPGGPFMLEMLGRLADEGVAPTSLRLVYSAGSALPGAVSGGFSDRFGLRVGQLYGTSEIGSVTFNDPGRGGDAPAGFDAGSVGLPMQGVSVIVHDPAGVVLAAGEEGHVLVSSPSMMRGYVGERVSAHTSVDGRLYFPTGDLGRVNAAGRLWITGRIKLLIDIGGTKVNPLEVETVLAEHPDVGRCVVVPVEVSQTVSRVKAIVTPRRSGGSVDVNALRAFARERLAGHKVPRVFEVRDQLPLSPTGKVLRWRLTSEAGDG
jgi:acyl-CoA synthetase (AMP-forming)/AMP-acid ligase II